MCSEKQGREFDSAFKTDSFKSCFARSVAVNSQYKQIKTEDFNSEKGPEFLENDCLEPKEQCLKISAETPVRYRKNNRSSAMDESRRFSCGSILSRRASTSWTKRSDIPIEHIYSQNTVKMLQWQLKEAEKSREMYKAVMKEVVMFLEKAHPSLELLGKRLDGKTSVPRSRSEHQIISDGTSIRQNQRSLIDEHLSSWSSGKKQLHPDEVQPEKLAQEAFRLLRTSQSILNTQEPRLTSAENLQSSEELSDMEFLAQVAKEFPREDQKPHRAKSFNLSPKLILPDGDVRISTAFNRKLSLQLNEVRRSSSGTFSRADSARTSVAESEALSLPPNMDRHLQSDPLRRDDVNFKGKRAEATPGSPAATSVSSMEDESGFSSMNSFQEVGLPIINSTAIEDVSPRKALLKSMLHNSEGTAHCNSDELNNSFSSDRTVKNSSFSERRFGKPADETTGDNNGSRDKEQRIYCSATSDERRNSINLSWDHPPQVESSSSIVNSSSQSGAPNYGVTSATSRINHQRWHSEPDKPSNSHSLKVLWV